MLDIKYIRDNTDKVKEAAKNKNIDVDIDELLKLDEEKRKLQTEINELRTKRNELAGASNGGKPTDEKIQEGKKLKKEIAEKEEKFHQIEQKFGDLMVKVPTVTSEDTPIGKDDSENIPVEEQGEKPQFDFTPKDHIQLGKDLDIIDIERGVKVAGYRGYYLKNQGMTLALALMMYALEKLISKGFTPMLPPTLIREFALFGTGYFAGKTFNSEVAEIY